MHMRRLQRTHLGGAAEAEVHRHGVARPVQHGAKPALHVVQHGGMEAEHVPQEVLALAVVVWAAIAVS